MLGAQAVVGVAGSLSAGSAQAKAHAANAAALEVQRQNRLEKARFDVEQHDRKFRRASGSRDALIGTTGIDAQSFSDVRTDDAAESALEKAAIMWSAQNEANMLQFQADAQRRQGKDAKTASYFNAASAALSAMGGYKKYQTMGVKVGGTFSPDIQEDPYG
jgi:hypothetical protein